MEIDSEKKKELHMVFIDLEKAYESTTQGPLMSVGKKGIHTKI